MDTVPLPSTSFQSLTKGLFFPEPPRNTITSSWKFSEVFKPRYLKPKIPPRFKRSTDNLHPTPVPNHPPKSKIGKRYSNLEFVGVKPDVLYRHPELSLEDQPKYPNFQSKKISQRVAVPSESFRRASSGLKEPIRVLQLPKDRTSLRESAEPLPKHAEVLPKAVKSLPKGPMPLPYIKVIQDCNETSPIEISDLNAPVDPTKFLGRIVVPETDPSNVSEEPQKISLETKESNGTYVSLQDHQAVINSSPQQDNPPDISPYNPANIPYVEVPDYTDRREESLDDNDRLSKDKSAGDSDLDNDAVDPGGQPLEEGEGSSSFGGRESDGAREDLSVGKKLANDSADTSRGRSDTGRSGKDSELTVRPEEERPIKHSSREDKGEEPSGANFYSKNITGSAEEEPISFDIEDYAKPFDLDRFIDELFHRDGRKHKESRVKASRRKPGDEGEGEGESEDEVDEEQFRDFYDSGDDSGSGRSDESEGSGDERQESKAHTGGNEEYQDELQDYFESAETRNEAVYAAADDHHRDQSSDDVNPKFQTRQVDGDREVKVDGQRVRKFLSKLPQYEDQRDKMKGRDEGNNRGKYYKHWVLEYNFPSSKGEKNWVRGVPHGTNETS
ncbi:dentin sialophosphoprotein-like [Diachasmimorpha longicaudata]|uniref:dentin sialophosphoprotein-like n=1 Tax=Diachasmimorpha longicaudata TaxID=58733 RepID=UPI0030B8878C